MSAEHHSAVESLERKTNLGDARLMYLTISPFGYAWKGAKRLATMDEFASEFKNRLVTRAEYLETGSALCESRFRSAV